MPIQGLPRRQFIARDWWDLSFPVERAPEIAKIRTLRLQHNPTVIPKELEEYAARHGIEAKRWGMNEREIWVQGTERKPATPA